MERLIETVRQFRFSPVARVLVTLAVGSAGPMVWSQEPDPTQSEAQAAGLYRNAVALQNRELYDLAADPGELHGQGAGRRVVV